MSTILLIFVRHWFFRTKFSTKFQRPIARLRRQRSSVRSVVLKFDFDLRRLQLRSWFILSPSRCFAQIGGPKNKPEKKIFFDRKRFSSSSVQLRLSFSQEGFDEERQKLSCFFCFVSSCSGPFSPGVSQRLQRQKTKPKKKKKRFKLFSNKLLQRNDGSKFVHSVRTAAWDISKKRTDVSILRPFGRKAEIFGPDPVSHRLRSHLDREEPGWRLHDRCAAGEVPKIFLFVCILAHQTFFAVTWF